MNLIHLYDGWWATAPEEDKQHIKETVQTGLQAGIIALTFTKADGTIRDMTATQSERIVPPAPVTETAKAPRAPNPDLCHVWDTKAEGWRSFRWDRLLAVAILGADQGPK